MRKYNDKTTMGGANNVFQTTCWFDINSARTTDSAHHTAIINNLTQKYWKPVYCYLRHKGYDNESSKDLTQGFFCEIVLGRELIKQADQSKGRFRTFLLTALEHYVVNVYRRDKAVKRSPRGQLLQFDNFDEAVGFEVPAAATPERIFQYAWASKILDEALTKVEQDCRDTGKTVHWQVFRARILSPILDDSAPPPLKEICSRYGVENETRASNMIVTVKRRFSAVLKRCLRQFVQSDSEVEDEFTELLRILSDPCAG